MLTQERATALTEFLTADEERASKLVLLEPSEALAEINALGNDFTLDELKEYGDALVAATSQGELDAESLNDVSGGSVTVGVVLGASAIAAGAAWLAGRVAANQWW